ncbi:hypothetical protein ACS0PU_009136 [Formica fusca]
MSRNVDPRMKKDTVSTTTSLAQDDLARNVSKDSTTERSGDDMDKGTLTTESTSVKTTTDEKPEKEVFVTLTLNRQPKNFHELAVYFNVRELLQEQLKDDYRLKGQISSYALKICDGSLKKKSFHDLSKSFAFSAKKDTLLMEHEMRKLPADSGTAGASIDFTLSILHDWYPFADERNCFLNKISLEKLLKSWSSNTLLKELVCRTCALYFIKSNKDGAMPEIIRDRDSEAAGQDDDIVKMISHLHIHADPISTRTTSPRDVISKPVEPNLLHTLIVHASSSEPGSYYFTRCQSRSLGRSINKLSKKNPEPREVFKKDYVPNAINVLNCVKDRLKEMNVLYEAKNNFIHFLCDMPEEKFVDVIKDVLTNK